MENVQLATPPVEVIGAVPAVIVATSSLKSMKTKM
jgi:hypothetical protein